MSHAPPTYLTTREVADLLRLKERKVYDLVATNQIPCVRVTGKLLFPRDLVEAWLARSTEFAGSLESLKERPPICAGSHDPLLDWAIREAETGLAVAFGGSLDGLRRLKEGGAMLAGAHIVEGGPGAARGYNIASVREVLAAQPIVVVAWAQRRQGLVVASGNPLAIAGAADLKGRRLIARQPGSGSHALLLTLLDEAGLTAGDIVDAGMPARTEVDVALAIAEGRAEAGLAIEAAARQYRLGFVPLAMERFDLVIWRRAFFEPPVQRLMAFARTPAFRARAAALGGYDLACNGEVRFNGA